jgi:archaellum component FlaC
MSVTIETDLRDILNNLDKRFDRMEQKIDTIQKDVGELKIDVTKLDGKTNGLADKIDGLQKTVDKLSIDVSASNRDISDLKGVKSLIVPGFVAILASLLTFVFRGVNLQ